MEVKTVQQFSKPILLVVTEKFLVLLIIET